MNTRVNLREVNFICIFYLNLVLLLKKIKRSKKGRIRVRGVALMRNKYGNSFVISQLTLTQKKQLGERKSKAKKYI